MMAVWCDECGAQVLLWPGDLKGIVNTVEGAVVAYRCGSGHDGATLIRRRGAAARVPSVAAAR